MRVSTIASAAAFLVAPALADNLHKRDTLGNATVVNKCSYPVYLWSIYKTELGCPKDKMHVLQTGERYTETFKDLHPELGVSIKISKSDWCGKPQDITQLEYKINYDATYGGNYLDVSFVDCTGGQCPGRDCFYMKSGNVDGKWKTNSVNPAICPILSCKDEAECATMAYILPDDVQTKSCDTDAPLEFYLCQEYPDDDSTPAPAPSSSKHADSPKPKPTSASSSSEEAAYTPEVAAAAVTEAPEPKKPNVKTEVEVVYITQTEYAYAEKRHAHGHAHVHRNFRA